MGAASPQMRKRTGGANDESRKRLRDYHDHLRVTVFLVVEEPIVIVLCKLECPLFAAPVQGADICDCGIVRHHAFLILSQAVPVAGKPPHDRILHRTLNDGYPIGDRADAVLLVVDGVFVLADEVAGGGYCFLLALEILKLEAIDRLALFPVPAQVQKHLVPVHEIADFFIHVCNPFLPSRQKSRPTRNYHLKLQARGESTKAPAPHISLRTCPPRTRFCICESERACRRSRP